MFIGIDGNEANVDKRVGANIYAYETLRFLHHQAQEDLRFKVYLKKTPLTDLPDESKNWQYQVFGPGRLWTQWRLPLKLYLDRDKPDVFFTPGHYAPRFSPVPTVVSIMDLAFLRFPNDFLGQDLRQLTAWTAYSVKQARHIFAISKATKQDIIKFYGIEPTKITVTYPGYDKEKFKVHPPARVPSGTWPAGGSKFKNKTQNLKRKYRININSDYLLYIGTLQPRKNLVRLLQAFTQVRGSYPQLQLVIVGKKGWLYEEIFRAVQRLGLDQKVVFTGFVPDDDLPALLVGARALVLPSLYEGFGIPVVEAMASGVPVVVSQTSSLPEIAGDAGVYIKDPTQETEISASLIKVLKLSQAERQRLINKGFKQVKRFSWEDCGEKTLEKLEEISRERQNHV